MVTSFSAFIISTCEGTNITNDIKRMLFWTGLHPEIRAAVRNDNDYVTFNAVLEAAITAERVLHLNTKYTKVFQSEHKDNTVNEAMDKGKRKVRNDSGRGCSSQGAS